MTSVPGQSFHQSRHLVEQLIHSKHSLNNSMGTRNDLYLHIPRPSLLSLPPLLICNVSPHRVESCLDFYRVSEVTWRGGRRRSRFWYSWWQLCRTDDQFLTRGFSFNICSSREKAKPRHTFRKVRQRGSRRRPEVTSTREQKAFSAL